MSLSSEAFSNFEEKEMTQIFFEAIPMEETDSAVASHDVKMDALPKYPSSQR